MIFPVVLLQSESFRVLYDLNGGIAIYAGLIAGAVVLYWFSETSRHCCLGFLILQQSGYDCSEYRSLGKLC